MTAHPYLELYDTPLNQHHHNRSSVTHDLALLHLDRSMLAAAILLVFKSEAPWNHHIPFAALLILGLSRLAICWLARQVEVDMGLPDHLPAVVGFGGSEEIWLVVIFDEWSSGVISIQPYERGCR